MPEGQRAELIDGVIYNMTPPNRIHQKLISIICDKNKLDDRGCNGAPDFIIEIVSPSSRKMDYSTKMTLYSNAGVREYWIVDPAKERTTIYRFEEDAAPTIIPFMQPIQVGIYNDLNITISELLK